MTYQDQPDNECTIDQLCINTIRTLSMDAIQKANSGHPGAPMGLATVAYALWTRFLKHNPRNPKWYNRDRFVLSGGHASMLLYSLLHLTGYDISLDDIQNFRQWESKTPGHPEYGLTPGVETTTGPLGQGLGNAVGMAMAERHLAARFNKPGFDIVDHYTYVICGDGDLMEGISSEAASLAGHLGLSKLICIYDDNEITIEGNTDITFTEDVQKRYESYRWQVILVENGNDIDAFTAAVEKARKENHKPSLIIAKTEIAYGSPHKQGTADAHGAPLGVEEVCLTKINLGCPEGECFFVEGQALNIAKEAVAAGTEAEGVWRQLFTNYQQEHPQLARSFQDAMDGRIPTSCLDHLPQFIDRNNPVATRAASGTVLNAIADKMPELMGGSADLAPSNKTLISSSHDFQKESYDGRNIRFGVREHAMAAIMSGMALHKGIRPYGGTFLVFADYMRPAIRLAALMKLPVIYIFTHDSIAVGEDGPTHQPVEHLLALRSIPGLTVIRPADANETVAAWRQALTLKGGPAALILSRQKLPILAESQPDPDKGLGSGAYILKDGAAPLDMILIATGGEVHITLEAANQLEKEGLSVRVVSMPSWELFDRTDFSYQNKVLPRSPAAKMAIEAGVSMGWERYVGRSGKILGIDHFGASAPGNVLLSKFGFTSENIVQQARAMLKNAV
jgi:transketolase